MKEYWDKGQVSRREESAMKRATLAADRARSVLTYQGLAETLLTFITG